LCPVSLGYQGSHLLLVEHVTLGEVDFSAADALLGLRIGE
jgi:hypothetical protein